MSQKLLGQLSAKIFSVLTFLTLTENQLQPNSQSVRTLVSVLQALARLQRETKQIR